VSIPIGSEESYSFKHMRKNQYEEALFKCEDERFEIDMIIDSNMSTIRVLEPLAEEINSLKAASARRDGSAGPRFSLQLEKRQLSTIHLNAISRIYGDHGEEILELLRKNPAGTVPVVLKRLKQKDQEWRRARQELNKHWKEVVEKNHYKSFDHRSFYFRQTDKKFLSTKPLVQEIVTAAANQAGGSSSSVKGVPAEDQGLGLNFAISPEFTELLAGMTPHLVLDYDHDAHLLHRDVYRLVCHAAETTLQNVSDRERVAALWRDLIRAFFNLPPHYLYSPSNLDGMNNNLGVTVAAEAWPRNSRVLTTYGSGKIISYREEDGMYEVELGFGKAFLGASAIFGMEQLPDAALYVSLFFRETICFLSSRFLLFCVVSLGYWCRQGW
jgi:paired amphipathic helix protein Sin3a